MSDKELSALELKIAQLVKESHSEREIGQMLSISENTVSHHLRSIYRKAGVHNRVGLAVFLFEKEFDPSCMAHKDRYKLREILEEKERGIVEHVRRGLTNKEIASFFKTSEQVIKNQLTEIFQALSIPDRVQLAVRAEREYLEELQSQSQLSHA